MKKIRRPSNNNNTITLAEIPLRSNENELGHFNLDPLFDLIDTSIFVTDMYGNLAALNDPFCKITGYSKEELIGKNFNLIEQHGEKKDTITLSANLLQKINIQQPVNLKIKHKQGYILQLSGSAKLVNSTNKERFTIITIKDVLLVKNENFLLPEIESDQHQPKPLLNKNGNLKSNPAPYQNFNKEKETSASKYQQIYKALVENDTDVICILTAFANPIYVSPSVTSVLGYSQSEAMQLTFTKLIHPQDLIGLKRIWKQILKAENINTKGLLYRMLHKDKTWRWVESSLTNMLQNESITGIVNKFRNITDRIVAEEKIIHSEENLSAIFENTKEGFILLDEGHRIKAFNEKARENNFLTREVKIGANIYDFVDAERIDYFKNIIENAFKGKTFEYEKLANNKVTNEQLWIQFTITPINKTGKIRAVCISANNITAQKTTEKQLLQYKNLLNKAESMAGIGSGEVNFEADKRIWSDQFYRILGLVPGNNVPEINGLMEFIHPEERENYTNWVNNGLLNRIPFQQIETRIITAIGKERNICVYKSTTYYADGKPNILIGVIQDITDRKILELQLAESKEIYQSLFYQNPTAVFSLDLEGNFTSANHVLAIKTECSEAEIMQLHYLDFVHPGDVETTKIHFENSKQGQTQEYAIRIITAKGHKFIAAIISLPIIINNKITGIYCLANDITSDINAKVVLNKTLADRQRILDYSLDVICEIDRYGKFIQVSKACKHLWGYTEEEMIGKNYIHMVLEEDKPMTLKMAALISAGGPVTRNFENRNLKKDGTIINLLWSVGWDDNEEILYCIAKDATEKKLQQQAIVLSEQRYKDLFNHNPLPLYIFNFSTHFIVEVNNAAIKKYGYTREEFLFLTVSDFCIKEELAEFEKMLKNQNSYDILSKKIWTHLKKNGETMHLNISGNIIDYNGKKSVLALMDDVTEKIKIAEQREFERRDKEALINGTNDDIWSINKHFTLIAGNKAFIKNFQLMTGVTVAPGDTMVLTGKTDDINTIAWKEMYTKALKGKSFKKEIIMNNPTTNLKQWTEVSFNPIYNGKEIIGIACYSRNITENKLYHNKLIEINKKLEMAQKMAKLGYYEHDIIKSNSFWSNEMYNIYEFNKNKLPISIRQITAVIHPDDRDRVLAYYKLAIEKKQLVNIEHRIILKDGSIKFLIQKGTIKYNDKGDAITLEGTSQDITKSKLAEQAVKESEEKYRNIFESNPLPNWIYDADTLQILKVNNAATASYGYKNNEFLKMFISDLFIGRDAFTIFKFDSRSSAQEIIKFGQWQHVTKNGNIINVTINGHTMIYNEKKSVMIVANDITEIIQSQLALAKSNERFDYATKATFDAIWEIDLVNKTMFWGEGFSSLFGYNLKDLEKDNQERENFIHPEDKQRVLKSLNDLINNRQKIYWTSQYQFLKKNGIYASVIDSALVVRDKEGLPYRIIGAMQDITERIKNELILKELNSQLNKRAVELASSNAELEQFAYIASHDLQEPLRMVTGFLKRIQKKYEYQLDETGRNYINFAVDGAVRMRQIILDLLEYSRVGTLQYQFEKINTNKLVNEVINIYTNIKQSQKIEFTHNELPEIFAAKTPIHQLFQNLISNAVKYHNPNTITKISITGKERKDHWYFSISDNGIGINNENFNNIFILFRRLHNKDEYSGTGIGLAICKKIIDNHKGKLWVTSIPGKGSTFYFTIAKSILI